MEPAFDPVRFPALQELLLFLPAGWLPGPSHPDPGYRHTVTAMGAGTA